jgi:creatinine amidohydrolase
MPPHLLLDHLTWPEVRAALDDGFTTVVFACGATEQHGPHLPLLVDAEIGTRVAVETARRLGRALVAPTVRVGCSDHHMAFPGTLSLRRETFQAVVRDSCASLAHHGFRRICILPSHGGNVAPLAEAWPSLREAAADAAGEVEGGEVEVLVDTDLMGLVELWKEMAAAWGAPAERVGGHADLAESSILLDILPELVRTDRAEAGHVAELSAEELDRVIREGLDTVTPNGILGDPRGMDRELGRRLVDAMAERLVGVFGGGEARK